MISDFQRLSDKITQLASLAGTLRHENAELRKSLSALSKENADLSARMQEAHQRISLLLEKIPALQTLEQDEECA